MTGPDANLTKNIAASCVFKIIVSGIYFLYLAGKINKNDIFPNFFGIFLSSTF
jgi:hypothetical protein